MPAIELNLNGDRAWPDIRDNIVKDNLTHLPDTTWRLAALSGGMVSGKTSLALRLDLPNGEVIVTETSLASWVATTCALRARFPEEFKGTPIE
jgi:hypothetical protein